MYKGFALLVTVLVTSGSLGRAEDAEFFRINCQEILVDVVKKVMVDMVECIMEMKKAPPGSQGECAIKCGMRKLNLVKDGSLRIRDQDVDAFLTTVSHPRYIGIGKIIIGGCLEDFDELPEERIVGQCQPYIDLLKCMQATFIEATAMC